MRYHGLIDLLGSDFLFVGLFLVRGWGGRETKRKEERRALFCASPHLISMGIEVDLRVLPRLTFRLDYLTGGDDVQLLYNVTSIPHTVFP